MALKKNIKHKYRVLIVDDHHIVRYGLTQLLNRENDFVVCAEAESSESAMKAAQLEKPDLSIVDISLKDSNGFDLIKNLKSQYPKMTILVLSMHDEAIYAERALRAGAMGYVMKQEINEKLIIAMRKIMGGKVYMSPEMTEKMMHKIVRSQKTNESFSMDLLSDREFELFLLLGQGIKIGQAARTLNMSVSTAEYHRANIRKKLGLRNADELTRLAIKWMQESYK